MLTKLTLENFKRHKNLVVNLTPGLNLITGPNFTGKSTLLQAIRYAFEGATAIPGGKATSTLHGEDDHKVELEMTINGSEYVITRSLKKASLTRDGKTIAKSASAVTVHISELLGMSGQRFGQLRYGKQKETEALLTLGATELHKIIGELSKVEIVNDVITKCGTAINECNGGLKILTPVDTGALQAEHASLLETLQNRHMELMSAVKIIDKNNLVLATLKKSLELATIDRQKSISSNAERKELAANIQDKVLSVDTFRETISNLFGADDKLKSMQESMGYYNQGIIDLSSKVAHIGALTKEQTLLQFRTAESKRKCTRLNSLLLDHAPVIDTNELSKKVAISQATISKISAKIIEVETAKASGVCPTCQRPYEKEVGWLETLNVELGQLKEQRVSEQGVFESVTRHLEAAQTSNESFKKTDQQATSMSETLRAQTQDFDRITLELEPLLAMEAPEALEEIKSKAKVYKHELSIVSNEAMKLVEARTELSNVSINLEVMQARFKELGPVEEIVDLSTLTQDVSCLETETAEKLSSYTERSTEYTRMSGELISLSNSIKAGEEQREILTKLEGRLHTAKSLVSYLRKNRDRFMGRIWNGIMLQASTFTESCTGGAITRMSRDDSGKFSYIEDGNELPVTSASGAQRSIMGLGVQLAMASLLPSPLSTIMLDEPSSDMDPERSLSMTTLLAAEHNQLLMVSHRELDGAISNNTIALEY